MIHEIARELLAALKAKGCPFPVVDGPESTTTTTYGRERIVVEHDEDAGDTFRPPMQQLVNPRSFATRIPGYKLTIYAQSANAGAREFEHRRRAEHVLDLVIVALFQIASTRKNNFVLSAGKFTQPADLQKSETIGGAVYELKFTFDRGICERNWDGSIAGEFTIIADTVKNTTKVSLDGGPDNDGNPVTPPAIAETACGT